MPALVKHPFVNHDIEETAFCYHQRDPDVAVRFVDEARHAMFAAAKNPLHYSVRFEDVRRLCLRHFPHSVFFTNSETTVFVLAVLHGVREVEKLVLGRKING
ncbi:MAG TPA: type II toxin-antitoxin system RelE/ParE family toxin [Verrucomicrobiae bacterium]